MKKLMIAMKIVAVLASLTGIAVLGTGVPSALLFLPLPLVNLLAVLKKNPGKVLKTLAVLVTLFVFWFLWDDLCWVYGRLKFFPALGTVSLVVCNLIAVLRPKLPRFLAEEKNPHILAAYVFAAILLVLLAVLVIKL